MDLVPHFTFYGYRYVEDRRHSGSEKRGFTRVFLITANITATGWMKTGSDLVNQLISNVRWGFKSAILWMFRPTDPAA